MKFAEFSQKKKITFLIGALSLVSISVLLACQVPVFRYALERWTVDPYELVIVPRAGGLTKSEEAALDFLAEASASVDVPLNLKIRIDKEAENNTSAAVASLFYPGKIQGFETKPIWRGGLTQDAAYHIVDSPLRRELAKRILKGQSSIWLLIESGDKAKDDAAEAMLKKEMARAEKDLKIPDGVVGKEELAAGAEAPSNSDNILQSDVPLKIKFSLIRVNRLNKDEDIFLKMFLNLEDDLGDWSNEAMAFPVFGRGRVLEPLIGRGITPDNIMEHSGYLCGACSCEVKEQNPGMDLLMAVNWDAAIDGSQIIIDKVLPPLEGTAVLMNANKKTEGSSMKMPEKVENTEEVEGKEASVADTKQGMMPYRTLLIALGAVVLMAILGTVLLKRRKG